MIKFNVKRNKFNTFQSAILEFDKEDIDLLVNLQLKLEDRLKQGEEHLQDTISSIKDFKNGESDIRDFYTLEGLEEQKKETEEKINKLKNQISILTNK